MDPTVEIRKLPIEVRSELIKLLEVQESWKKLMAIVPQNLIKDNYICDISPNNPAKYHSEDFHIIENASEKKRLFASEILLREWGTSGRVRPNLGHLKYLLEKAQLFRAADYITVDVLRQARPVRPLKGPAAPVRLRTGELDDNESKRIEKLLDKINYPSSAIENINKISSINTNLNYTTKNGIGTIPKIIISPDIEEKPSVIVPIVVPNESTKSEPDLIQFSTNTVVSDSGELNSFIPTVLDSSSESSSTNIPVLVNESVESSVEPNLPHLTSLLSESDENSESNLNIPAVSGLNISESESSIHVPALSQLLADSDFKSANSKNSRTCTSPLPNLSLNTSLPHFTYSELEIATKNFDETPVVEGGRFLGSGAFGKVYLAENILTKPVAVKKMLLDNGKEVQLDDTVTKQFKNEVEILSKYKHENLVTLLGYSCDGLTYCLLYEYVPGGALKDHIQKRELIWTERLYIALGTSRAISYLHTAFSTPLIHRDIKTANILLDITNKPKLCDFGLIKHSLTQNTSTATTIVGTSAYMAPEAFRGDISIKLDTFSFGVVLLELLTSLPPTDENREGVDLVTHVQDHCHGEITPLLDTSIGTWIANNINFGEKLFIIAQDCLKEKKQRPTMSAICKILSDLVQESV